MLAPDLTVKGLVFSHGEIFNICLSQMKLDYSEKIPDITRTSKEGKDNGSISSSARKSTVFLWGNSDGGHKLKPCLVYYSGIPLH